MSQAQLDDVLRVAPDLDVWLVPGMAQKLGFCPSTLQRDLEKNYPSLGSGDEIPWGEPVWVRGDNRALRYRGNELKREKMWFQRGNPRETRNFLRYLYTGWQWRVLPATSGVDTAPELKPAVDALVNWTLAQGYSAPNHYIITRYKDGDANIGAHFDKPASIEPGSLITVIKLGEAARPFKLERLDGTVVFDKVLPPGTGVVMTLEANLKTKHSVPVCEVSKPSGSLVARTIHDSVSWEALQNKIESLDRATDRMMGKRKDREA